MTAFLVALLALIGGYFIYGKIVDNLFGPTDKPTPAMVHNDGVDYIPLPTWKVFMIQLLNIAGLGPIFGALGGAIWGPSVYLWIVFGTIFAGGVHDYLFGMIYSNVSREGLNVLDEEYCKSSIADMRFMNNLIIYTAVTPLCFLYVLFFIS